MVAVGLALIALASACGGYSADDYLSDVKPLYDQYNGARDVVDQTIRSVESVTTLKDYDQAAARSIGDLQSAIRSMNAAYVSFGARDVREKFRDHQQASLEAWRIGIEAAMTYRLFLEKEQSTGVTDVALVVAANRLWGEEDRLQLEARRVLQAAR